MAEVGIERRQFVEMELGAFDIVHLVGDLAEEIVGVADLPRLVCKLERRFAEVARLLEIVESKVAKAEIDVRLGDVHGGGDERKRFFDQRDAVVEFVIEQLRGAEVFECQGIDKLVLGQVVETFDQSDGLFTTFDGPRKLRVHVVDASELVQREMTTSFELDPPLAVDVGIGSNWLEAK